jgi:hypothetical protein
MLGEFRHFQVTARRQSSRAALAALTIVLASRAIPRSFVLAGRRQAPPLRLDRNPSPSGDELPYILVGAALAARPTHTPISTKTNEGDHDYTW